MPNKFFCTSNNHSLLQISSLVPLAYMIQGEICIRLVYLVQSSAPAVRTAESKTCTTHHHLFFGAEYILERRTSSSRKRCANGWCLDCDECRLSNISNK